MKRAKPMQSESEVAVKMSQKTELDLFSKPLEQNVILSVHDFQYGSESIITQNGPIQFSPATNNEYFTDLANVYLKVQLQVFKSDGSLLTEEDEDKVVPVCDFMDSLFSRIVIYLGETPIGSETANHPQLSYFRYLLNYGENFKKGALENIIGYGEEIKLSDGKIAYATWRHDLIEKSRLVTLCGRLQNSFFNCSKLLLPNVPIRIRLDRTYSAFSLITRKDAPETYKINISDCVLYMRKVTVAPQTVSTIEHKLTSQPSVYPYMRTELRHFLIPQGSQSIKHNNVFVGQLPTRLLVTVCPTSGLSGGSFENNPMVFSPAEYNLNYCQFYINEMPVLSTAYQPNFETGDYVMSYVGLLRSLRLMNSSAPQCPISYKAFGGASGIFAIDLSPDSTNLAKPLQGSVSVELRFKNNIKKCINAIVVAEFRSCVFIDKNRNIVQNDL